MDDNELDVSWEFDAPKYYDFQHPERSSQGDDSWFDKKSASPEITRNRLRLRNRQQQQQQQQQQQPTFTLPPPSRPISLKSTIPSSPSARTNNRPAPTSTRRDIFTALASTQSRPSISSSSFSSKKLPSQQHAVPSVPESSTQPKNPQQQPEFARPVVTTSNQNRIAKGRRDVVAELKRITDLFAQKQPTDELIPSNNNDNNNSNEKQEQGDNTINNNTEKEIDNKNLIDNDKENVPPHERQQKEQHQQQKVEKEEKEEEELLPPQPISPRLPSLPSSENPPFWLQQTTSKDRNDENQNVMEHEHQGEEQQQEQRDEEYMDDEEEPMEITLSGRSLHDELQEKRPDTTISSAGTGRYKPYDNETVDTDNQVEKQPEGTEKRRSFMDEMVSLLDSNRNLQNTATDRQKQHSLHRKGSVVNEVDINDENQTSSSHSIVDNNNTIDRRDSWHNDETSTTMDLTRENDIHPIDEESPFLAPPSTVTTTSYRYQLQGNKRNVDMSNVNKPVLEQRPQRPLINLPSSSSAALKKPRLSTISVDHDIKEQHEKQNEKEEVVEEAIEESTRMRRWLDDLPSQLDNASVEKSRSVPQIKLTSSSSLSSLSTHQPITSETKNNSNRYTPTSVRKTTTTTTTTTGPEPVTTNNFDVLFERMAIIRSELLQIAKTSEIKPDESDLMRNMERLKVPLQGGGEEENDQLPSPSSNIMTIEQRIARARRVIEESKRDSEGWFSKDGDKKVIETSLPPPLPLLSTLPSTKRKNTLHRQQEDDGDDDNYSTTRSTYSSTLLTTMRPNKIRKSFSTYPVDIIRNSTTRRESMQHDISIAERVRNLKQAASRRASRVSIIPSYLPIEPTVPKSPRFATDTRSR